MEVFLLVALGVCLGIGVMAACASQPAVRITAIYLHVEPTVMVESTTQILAIAPVQSAERLLEPCAAPSMSANKALARYRRTLELPS